MTTEENSELIRKLTDPLEDQVSAIEAEIQEIAEELDLFFKNAPVVGDNDTSSIV